MTVEQELTDFAASALGTKEYWDAIYERDQENFNDFGDVGEIWFGEDVEEKMVDWLVENIADKHTRMMEVGCGNGHLLVELARFGFDSLVGMDYSLAAVKLAEKYAEEEGVSGIEFGDADIFDVEALLGRFGGQVQVVLDKGTFDAISLMPSENLEEKGGAMRQRDHKALAKYLASVERLLVSGGTLLITSCNWTETELEKLFAPHFDVQDRIQHPVFEFGGIRGQAVSTLALQKRQ